MALADRAELAVRLTLDDRAFTGGLRRSQSALGRFGASAGRVGRGIGQIGTGLARAGLLVGGAAVAGIAAATREALNFEDAFAGVRKTVSEAELTAAGTSFEELRSTFLRMSSEMPLAASEFARLGEIAGALGVKAQDIDDFAKTTALLGVTTNLSADEAADALGRIGTILDFTGKDFEHFSDILVNLGNQGASTEAEIIEITKRFAGVGSQAGLSVEQITALSSAISSLGAQPEAAGSALSRIFANLQTEIANGTAKGKEFAEVTGDSLAEFKKRIDQGDALGIFMETLEELSKMSRTEQASVLKALGITNVRDRDAIVKMSENLDEVNRQLNVAENSTGALAAEAAKRFDSPLQKLITLRGAAVRLAIAFGDGIAPAIGRAADKLAVFFRDEGNLNQATQFGQNIGKAIDEIDWAKVIAGAKRFGAVLKGAGEFALLILKTLDKLPAEIKAAGVGFLALNKLSGGLIAAGAGNVVGGIGEGIVRSAGSKLPGVGKLFAQPVFVTNWPLGGIGGTPTAGGGTLGTIARGAAAIAMPVSIVAVGGQAALALGEAFNPPGSRPSDLQGMITGQRGLIPKAGATDPWNKWVNSGSPVTLNQSGSPDERQERNDQAARAARQQAKLQALNIGQGLLKAALVAQSEDTKAKIDQTTAQMRQTKAGIMQKVDAARTTITQGGHTDKNAIVAAIHANRPIVSVVVNAATNYTTVVKTGQTTVAAGGRFGNKQIPVD